MAESIAVQCDDCGQPYSARLVDSEVILPTSDGKCVCGNDEFMKVEASEGDDTTSTGSL